MQNAAPGILHDDIFDKHVQFLHDYCVVMREMESHCKKAARALQTATASLSSAATSAARLFNHPTTAPSLREVAIEGERQLHLFYNGNSFGVIDAGMAALGRDFRELTDRAEHLLIRAQFRRTASEKVRHHARRPEKLARWRSTLVAEDAAFQEGMVSFFLSSQEITYRTWAQLAGGEARYVAELALVLNNATTTLARPLGQQQGSNRPGYQGPNGNTNAANTFPGQNAFPPSGASGFAGTTVVIG